MAIVAVVSVHVVHILPRFPHPPRPSPIRGFRDSSGVLQAGRTGGVGFLSTESFFFVVERLWLGGWMIALAPAPFCVAGGFSG